MTYNSPTPYQIIEFYKLTQYDILEVNRLENLCEHNDEQQ